MVCNSKIRGYKGRNFCKRITELEVKVLANCTSKSKATEKRNHRTELREEKITEFQTRRFPSSNSGSISLSFFTSIGRQKINDLFES
jgi:hypothetical protein